MQFFKNNSKFIAVDADSIEEDLRKIIINLSKKKNINVLFVADRHLKDVASARLSGANVAILNVTTDFDSADNAILSLSENIFFCITHDRKLAERLREKNISCIDKRGNMISNCQNIQYKGKKLKDNEFFSKQLEDLSNTLGHFY